MAFYLSTNARINQLKSAQVNLKHGLLFRFTKHLFQLRHWQTLQGGHLQRISIKNSTFSLNSPAECPPNCGAQSRPALAALPGLPNAKGVGFRPWMWLQLRMALLHPARPESHAFYGLFPLLWFKSICLHWIRHQQVLLLKHVLFGWEMAEIGAGQAQQLGLGVGWKKTLICLKMINCCIFTCATLACVLASLACSPICSC